MLNFIFYSFAWHTGRIFFYSVWNTPIHGNKRQNSLISKNILIIPASWAAVHHERRRTSEDFRASEPAVNREKKSTCILAEDLNGSSNWKIYPFKLICYCWFMNFVHLIRRKKFFLRKYKSASRSNRMVVPQYVNTFRPLAIKLAWKCLDKSK